MSTSKKSDTARSVLRGPKSLRALEMPCSGERVSGQRVFGAPVSHLSVSLEGEKGALRHGRMDVGDEVGISASDPEWA